MNLPPMGHLSSFFLFLSLASSPAVLVSRLKRLNKTVQKKQAKKVEFWSRGPKRRKRRDRKRENLWSGWQASPAGGPLDENCD